MANVDIALVRQYLRVLEGEDDIILSFLLDAAESELKECGVVIPEQIEITDETEVTKEILEAQSKYETFMNMYRLAVSLYVSMHYENRSAAVDVDKLSVSYNNILLKIKKWGENNEIRGD